MCCRLSSASRGPCPNPRVLERVLIAVLPAWHVTRSEPSSGAPVSPSPSPLLLPLYHTSLSLFAFFPLFRYLTVHLALIRMRAPPLIPLHSPIDPTDLFTKTPAPAPQCQCHYASSECRVRSARVTLPSPAYCTATGLIGRRHTQHALDEPRIHLTCIIDPTPAGEGFASERNLRLFKSVEDMLSARAAGLVQVDAAIVAVCQPQTNA